MFKKESCGKKMIQDSFFFEKNKIVNIINFNKLRGIKWQRFRKKV